MNARKGVAAHVLDPFEVEDGWFALNLSVFKVVPGTELPEEVEVAVEDTIERLHLNDSLCCDARAEYAHDYWDGQIQLDYVTRRTPFVAGELRRQGKLLEGDI